MLFCPAHFLADAILGKGKRFKFLAKQPESVLSPKIISSKMGSENVIAWVKHETPYMGSTGLNILEIKE